MQTMWMIRSGQSGGRISEFQKGYIGVGYNKEVGDLTQYGSRENIMEKYQELYPNRPVQTIMNAVGCLFKFNNEIAIGDQVITYDNENREYLIGVVNGNYQYSPGILEGFDHIRTVKWENKFSRDKLSISSRNTLGSALTLFKIPDDVNEEIKNVISGKVQTNIPEELLNIDKSNEIEQSKLDAILKAHELLKDKILTLDDYEMQDLVAAILRAMGYKTRVSEPGPDRGIDVFASKDGLGFEEPRIKAEVKHRSKTQIGAPQIRSFMANLRQGDRGLYVSTGGFSKEAKYEADRSTLPLALVNLDDLADLITSHYEKFDIEGKSLINLVRVYWPAE